MFPADWLHTVSTSVTTTTENQYGDATTAIATVVVTDVLYAPEGITEAAGLPVVGQGSLYGAFPLLDADDSLTHSATCACDGAVFPRGEWQVVGGAKGWAPGKIAVPVKRVSSV